MSLQSHLDNFVVNVYLEGAGDTGETIDFSKLILVDTLGSTTGSAGSDFTVLPVGAVAQSFGTAAGSKLVAVNEADDYAVAGFGSEMQAMLSKVFGARRHPSSVHVMSIDTIGGDDFTTIWAALEPLYSDWFAAILVTDQDGEIALVPPAVKALSRPHIVFAGLSDKSVAGQDNGTWLSSTSCGALVAGDPDAADLLFLTFHQDNAKGTVFQQADYAEYAAIYCSADFDNLAPGANIVLTRTSELQNLTGTEKANLDLNFINHALPMKTSLTYVDAGVMISGRDIYQMTTAFWLENRMQLEAAGVKEFYASAIGGYRKLPLTTTGQAIVKNALDGVYGRGVRAEHILDDTEIEAQGLDPAIRRAEPITRTGATSDLALKQMRFTYQAYVLHDTRKITINVYLRD